MDSNNPQPLFRQSAIDDMNNVAAALSGEPEIARLKEEIAQLQAKLDALVSKQPKEERGPTKMLYINGSKGSFRCEECHSNCFQQPKPISDPTSYECNGCSAMYRGE